MKRSHSLAAAFGLVFAQPTSAALQVKVITGAAHGSGCTFGGDDMLLTVSNGNLRLANHKYCSAYGRGSARLVRDATGQPYIFVYHSATHGSHATTDLLTVYRLDRKLVRRARLPISVPIGSVRNAVYHYELRKPRSGGLELVGRVTVVGKASSLDIHPERAQRLSIDVSAPRRPR